MKVLLLFKPNPEIRNINQNVIPNGLLYIGALLLKNNFDVEVLNLSNKSWDESKEIIKNKNPDIVGIGCYTFNRHTCIKLAGLVKKINEKIKVVFGGPHSSIMYSQLFENCKDIDLIVLNEGEMSFLDIVQAKPLETIRGIVYRKDNKIIKNPSRKPLEALDELPIPANYFKYKRIITSRGCPGNCIFCDTPALWGRKVRLRSATNVVDELELLNQKYGISSFIISDDTFTLDKERTIDICKQIIDRNLKIKWDCRSRVNLICKDRLNWMKKAGCTVISYGIESGSQTILNNLRKGITVDQIKKAASLTRKYCLNLNYFLIVGTPGETDDTVRETMKLIEATKPTSVQTYIMQLTPGTFIYEKAKQDGLIDDNYWMENKEEVVYYTAEMDIKQLKRYMQWVNNSFDTREFQYTEAELNDITYKGSFDFVNLAQIKMKQRKFNEAETLVDNGIELNPGSSSALMLKAVLLAMKKDKSCIDFFNRSISSDPENLAAYENLGLFYFKSGMYDQAIDVFKNAIEIEPANLEFYNNLGSVYGVKGEYDTAIEMFNKVLSIDPCNKGAKSNLKVTLDKKNARDTIRKSDH